MTTIRSLLILLELKAPSFCYYEPGAESAFMSIELFEKIVNFARKQDLSLQIIAPQEGIPTKYRAALDDLEFISYVPAAAAKTADSDDAVVVSSWGNPKDNLPDGGRALTIARMAPKDLSNLCDLIEPVMQRSRRINIIVKDILDAKDDDIDRYFNELLKFVSYLSDLYERGNILEVNAITDRIFLSNPNDCGAGIEHVTIGPDGQVYLCPGFAVSKELALGTLDGFEYLSKPELIYRNNAPICSGCDAYHCKRCIYLNYRATKELNTPPWQMCVISHAEREASRRFLLSQQAAGQMVDLPPIPILQYYDPIERFGPKSLQLLKKRRATIFPEGSVCVGCVSADEREEIRVLMARREAIRGLLVFVDNYAPGDLSELYGRTIRDLEEVELKVEGWWRRVTMNYKWSKPDTNHYTVDFNSCEVWSVPKVSNKVPASTMPSTSDVS